MDSHIKEGLSKSYIMAVAHMAGYSYEIPHQDYGIDGTIREVQFRQLPDGKKRYHDTGFNIDFQLKASENFIVENGIIKYDLEAKNYNDLVDTEVGTQRILILFTLPKDRNEWLNINRENTVLKNCAWWCSLIGKPPTNNRSTVRITIPTKQLLTVEELQRIMGKVKRGELL
jgi:hypothetical protein